MARPLSFTSGLILALLAAAPAAAGDAGAGEVVARINTMRGAVRLPPLERQAALDGLAHQHAEQMASHGRLAHVFPGAGDPASRVSDTGLEAREVAQQVAHGSDAIGAYESLVRSDVHRQRLLDPDMTHIGVAVVETSAGAWMTQLLVRLPLSAGDPSGSTSAADSAPPVEMPPPGKPPEAPPSVGDPSTPSGPLGSPLSSAPQQADSDGPPQNELPEGDAAHPPDAPSAPDVPGPAPDAEPEAETGPEGFGAVPASASEASPGNARTVEVEVRGGAGVRGYWVRSGGRWWYFPLPPDARPGQVLQPDPGVRGPPPAARRSIRQGAPSAERPFGGWSPRRRYDRWLRDR